MERKLQFEDGSRLVPIASEQPLPETAVAAGAACARAAGGGRILISHSGECAAAALAAAFASGAASAGADCILTETCPATAAAYAAKALKCAMGCYIHTELSMSVKLFASDGLPLFADTEMSVETELEGGSPLPFSHFGSITGFDGSVELYTAELKGLLGGKLRGFYADISSPSAAVMSCCEKILAGRNDRSGSRVAFHISSDGSRASAYTDETGYVSGEKLVMICCRDLFESGRDAAVCGKSSRTLEKMAAEYGRRIISCGKNICTAEGSPSEECSCARKLASEQLFMHDGIALAVRTLDILRRKGTTLGSETDSLPPFAGINRYIPCDKPSELLKRLCTPPADCRRIDDARHFDGVLSDNSMGRVVIRPVRTGKGVMLNVESYAAETAAELCDYYCGIVTNNL